MSKVISIVGAGSAPNQKIQQQVGLLKFHFKTPDAQAADWPTLIARMNGVIVNVDLQTKNGQQTTLIPKIPMGTLAELYSTAEQFIQVSDNGVDHDVEFGVELGYEGALAIDADTTIVVDVTGMVANDALDVYAMDLPLATRIAVKTNVIRFQAGVAQSVGLQSNGILHLPAASFSKLEIFYPNGKNLTLEQKEVEQWCLEGNEVVGFLNGVAKLGFIKYYSINVADATSAKVTLSADANGYVFTPVSL